MSQPSRYFTNPGVDVDKLKYRTLSELSSRKTKLRTLWSPADSDASYPAISGLQNDVHPGVEQKKPGLNVQRAAAIRPEDATQMGQVN